MKSKRLVPDTSVIVEYLDEESPYIVNIEKLYTDIARGRVRVYIPLEVLSEVIYVSTKIYKEAGFENPNREAMNFINWLLSYPNVSVATPSLQISILTGELRKRMRISLIDCYVIATAYTLRATPLFLRLEKEMKPYIEILVQYNVQFVV